MNRLLLLTASMGCLLWLPSLACAQRGSSSPPKIYLDKGPRIVAYQLKRLDNDRLLMVQRDTTDAKYVPVYEAILVRQGMSKQDRQQAIDALVTLRQSDEVSELLAAMSGLAPSDAADRDALADLAKLLLGLPKSALKAQVDALQVACSSESPVISRTAFAALMNIGETQRAWQTAAEGDRFPINWLSAIASVRPAEKRNDQRSRVLGLLEQAADPPQRVAVIRALGNIPGKADETFRLLSPLFDDDEVRTSAVVAMLNIPSDQRSGDAAAKLAAQLVEFAENTPPADRTSGSFIDAMQLADQLLGGLPTETAKAFRARLREVTVRVVRIKTVEEEMRYDLKHFAVEAGRPVQIVLENHDLMPHNLVFTTPGALKDVAMLGMQAGPNNGVEGKPYVPESDSVLAATDMIQADKQTTLTFTTPSQPGEYPYVCTFPQHWYRMYGVMVVVEDLDAWLKNPTTPADPIGNNRSFVKKWTADDLLRDIDSGLRGRSSEIGRRIFGEASCLGCHRMNGEGGKVGPELTNVYTKWKGNHADILREIFAPSDRIDEKYAMQSVLTGSGQVVNGIVEKEDDTGVWILDNPEAEKPTFIPDDEIEEIVRTKNSMMPKALLDQYTQDEIFELIAYLQSSATP
ncbi:MAG: c-type cytochrome [Planctomycetota bacterium]